MDSLNWYACAYRPTGLRILFDYIDMHLPAGMASMTVYDPKDRTITQYGPVWYHHHRVTGERHEPKR